MGDPGLTPCDPGDPRVTLGDSRWPPGDPWVTPRWPLGDPGWPWGTPDDPRWPKVTLGVSRWPRVTPADPVSPSFDPRWPQGDPRWPRVTPGHLRWSCVTPSDPWMTRGDLDWLIYLIDILLTDWLVDWMINWIIDNKSWALDLWFCSTIDHPSGQGEYFSVIHIQMRLANRKKVLYEKVSYIVKGGGGWPGVVKDHTLTFFFWNPSLRVYGKTRSLRTKTPKFGTLSQRGGGGHAHVPTCLNIFL